MKTVAYHPFALIVVAAMTHVAAAFAPWPTYHKMSLKSSVAEPMPKQDAPDKRKNTIKQPTDNDIRHANQHKKWGVDNNNEQEYWFDSRIHTLGNCGFMGAVHAALAPVSTKLIDHMAYDGIDIRKQVAGELSERYQKGKARVLDMCCGVGFSTRALREAFPDAETVVGLDTSSEMLSMAKFITYHIAHMRPWWDLTQNKIAHTYHQMVVQSRNIQRACSTTQFTQSNAENTPFEAKSFDVVTIMYAFHEAPWKGRAKILEEARRLLAPGGVIAVVDISTDYTPSASMLAGEPYVKEYQKNIHAQLNRLKGFSRAQYKNLVPGHVGMWVLQRSAI